MTEQVISPLRRRMIEDMTIRKFAPKTQHDYVQRVKEFAVFLGHSPETARAEDVRRFQLHLASSGAGRPKINATVAALRFFFNVTLGRTDLAKPLRHCPKCQGAAAKQWLAERAANLLPVPYYHIVFTLPAPIGDIAYQNKAAIYDIKSP